MTAYPCRKSMRLSELLSGLAAVSQAQDVTVTGVAEYSRDVERGDVFLAVSGLEYVAEAIAQGAVAVVCEARCLIRACAQDRSLVTIALENLAASVVQIASRFYTPEKYALKTIAITGTDGKSSVAHLVAQALEKSGQACGLLGTLGYGRLNHLSAADHTMPPLTRLYKEYDRYVAQGCAVVAMEASSHGIDQNRLQGVPVYTAVLTNITCDHLDYHHSIENYVNAKAKLFFNQRPAYAVINLDDANGRQWCRALASMTNVITFSLADHKADVYASAVRYLHAGARITLNIHDHQATVSIPLLGEFNVLNVLAAAAVLLSLKKNYQDIMAALKNIRPVPGRMQRVAGADRANIIIDYAHTPAALLAAINALRQHYTGKVICVFGCGGDRDSSKRPQMGAIASRYADAVIVTSDNPRTETPQKIIDDIISGCLPNTACTSIPDRRQAIVEAIKKARREDSVLIAGKGHEKYQIIGRRKIKFDDAQVVRTHLRDCRHG